MQDRAANFFSLFASTSTLICCALPALFVVLGAGASFASLLGVFPFLIVLSQYKIAISLFALIMIVVAGVVNYKTARMPCPADPELGRACLQIEAAFPKDLHRIHRHLYLRQHFHLHSAQIYLRRGHDTFLPQKVNSQYQSYFRAD